MTAELRDIKDRSPNPALVEMLEELLERAKAGDIRSAFVVSSRDDNATGHDTVIDGRTWVHPMLGQLAYLQAELMAHRSIKEGGVLGQALT